MNKKIFAILSLVFALSPLTMFLIKSNSIDVAKIAVIIYFILSIAAIVCGIIGRSANKKMAIAGIVIGAISFIMMGFSLIGIIAISKAKDCVPMENGNYKCKLLDQDMEVPAIYLREDQKKTSE